MAMNTVETIVKDLCEYKNETEWFEFKENWFEPEALGEYISAISNSSAIIGKPCGYFVWGIKNDTHEITGTTFDCNQEIKNEPLKHYLSRKLSPDIAFEFSSSIINGARVVLLTIPAAKRIPTAYAGVRYFRLGSSKEKLEKYPEWESRLFSVLRSGLPSIENTPSNYQDLSFEKLMIYYGAKGLPLKPETFKKNLGLLTKDGEYNILAQLLSDNSHMPMRAAIFSGRSKAANLYSVREFGYQCLLYSLDEVLRYGDVLNIIQADERDRVVERKDVPLFENDAFREAIINAFVHNDWLSGNEPMISVYSDRIEILSRGSLAPAQTMEGFFNGESIPVNPRLSEVIMQLHISEKTGRGVPTIIRKYGRQAFEFRQNSIAVTIPFNWINVMHDRVGDKIGDNVGDKIVTGLTEKQAAILAEIRNNQNIKIPQIAQRLHLSKTTIDKGIAALKKYGYIEHVGAKRNGRWEVLK